ncbi:MAG: hypothetical protein ACTSXH_17910 [Promethearchaeota archaeon]
MTWGGFLGKEGSNYYRLMRRAEKSIEFLEDIKNFLNEKEKRYIVKTIEIITTYINKLSERGKKDLE